LRAPTEAGRRRWPGRRSRTRSRQGPAARGLIAGRALAIGASLAALLAGCGGGSNEKTYSLGPTEQCLRAHRERVVRNPRAPVLALNYAYLRFHPSAADAK